MARTMLLVFLMLPLLACGQNFAFEYWHEGKIVLESGDTLKGNIKYNMQTDVLQYQANKKIEAFTARKVLYCEIFDNTVKKYRQFFSLPYNTSGGYRAPIFFELLTEGRLTLLSREKLEYRTYNSSFYYYGNYTRLVLVNKYYLLQEKGDIVEINDKKSNWLDQMGNYADEVQKYAKKNGLDFSNKYDLAKLVEYYNSLTN